MTKGTRLTLRAIALLCVYAPLSGAIAARSSSPADLVVAALVGIAGLVHICLLTRQPTCAV